MERAPLTAQADRQAFTASNTSPGVVSEDRPGHAVLRQGHASNPDLPAVGRANLYPSHADTWGTLPQARQIVANDPKAFWFAYDACRLEADGGPGILNQHNLM